MVSHISGLKTRKHELLTDKEKQFLFMDLVIYQAQGVGAFGLRPFSPPTALGEVAEGQAQTGWSWDSNLDYVTSAPRRPWEKGPRHSPDGVELGLKPPLSASDPSGHHESTRLSVSCIGDPEIGEPLGFQ